MKKAIYTIFLLLSIVLLNGCSKSEDSPVTPSSDGNRYPNAPSNPNPSNGAVDISGFITATWNCSDPDVNDTLRYDVYAGLTNPPGSIVTSNTLNKAADIGVGSRNTLYYWRMIAKDNHGGITTGPIWNYKTAP